MPRSKLIERNQPPRKHRTLYSADVVRFEATEKYVAAYSLEGDILLRDTLKDLEAEFPERFFRAHHSHLVDVQRITRIDVQRTRIGGTTRQRLHVELRGVPELVPLGRRQLGKLLACRPDLKA